MHQRLWWFEQHGLTQSTYSTYFGINKTQAFSKSFVIYFPEWYILYIDLDFTAVRSWSSSGLATKREICFPRSYLTIGELYASLLTRWRHTKWRTSSQRQLEETLCCLSGLDNGWGHSVIAPKAFIIKEWKNRSLPKTDGSKVDGYHLGDTSR